MRRWSGRFKGAHGCCSTGTDKPRLAGVDSNACGRAGLRAAVGGDCSAAVRRGVAAKGSFQDCVWAGSSLVYFRTAFVNTTPTQLKHSPGLAPGCACQREHITISRTKGVAARPFSTAAFSMNINFERCGFASFHVCSCHLSGPLQVDNGHLVCT